MTIFDTLTITSYDYNTDCGSDVYVKNILKITDSKSLDEIVGKTVKCNPSIVGSKIKYLEHLTKPMRMRASRKIEWLPDY